MIISGKNFSKWKIDFLEKIEKNFLDYKILKIEKSKIENLINLKNQKLKNLKFKNELKKS